MRGESSRSLVASTTGYLVQWTLVQGPQEFHTVHARHLQVQEDGVERLRGA
jgi:hypothetical protein